MFGQSSESLFENRLNFIITRMLIHVGTSFVREASHGQPHWPSLTLLNLFLNYKDLRNLDYEVFMLDNYEKVIVFDIIVRRYSCSLQQQSFHVNILLDLLFIFVQKFNCKEVFEVSLRLIRF